MAVTLINPFVVAPGMEAEFLEGWKTTAHVFAGKPGYLDTRLHRSLDANARFRFVNVAHWESAETWADAMKAFPPSEGGHTGIEANPALYAVVEGGEVEAQSDRVEAHLRALEEGLGRAYMANDDAFLAQVLSDDYAVTDGPGTTSDKAKVLEDHRTKRLQVRSFQFDSMEVVRLGPDAAMVTGQYTWDASYAGHPIPTHSFRYSRVYVRDAAGWRVKIGQVTPILQPHA